MVGRVGWGKIVKLSPFILNRLLLLLDLMRGTNMILNWIEFVSIRCFIPASDCGVGC